MQHKEIGQSEASQVGTTSKNCPFAVLKSEPCWRVRVYTAGIYFWSTTYLSHTYVHTHKHTLYTQTQRRHGCIEYCHEIITLPHLAKKKEEQMFCACVLCIVCVLVCIVYCMCTHVYCVLYVYLCVLCIVCVLVCIVYCMCTCVYCVLYVYSCVLCIVCVLVCIVYCMCTCVYCVLYVYLCVLCIVCVLVCTVYCVLYEK